ncbi:7059_t:CDS:1 [Cetraspora pellucida]|uniref:7059_t:CDS:1 n=1 Tax=Cetraspora pellucida TaxID=1433469 RepID=A0ACA9MFG8_9GLOM|nr:7059_t:CDS:1 [Cetraspora pellucida]
MSYKHLQIPSGSGKLDHIQELINNLKNKVKELKKENEELKNKLVSNNQLKDENEKLKSENKEIAALKKMNKTIDSQLNIALNVLKINFDINISIGRKMKLVVEEVEAYSQITNPE